ncbi:MAG: hypothetical protein LUH15_08015 [Tannerellaceae bacterium]|nr:hypothetical protein [Tannerellaceae bacterium]
MEKKYNLPGEESQKDILKEPAIAYDKTYSTAETEEWDSLKSICPGIFTDEEKLQRIDKSLQDLDAGIYLTHQEVLKKFKDRL